MATEEEWNEAGGRIEGFAGEVCTANSKRVRRCVGIRVEEEIREKGGWEGEGSVGRFWREKVRVLEKAREQLGNGGK